MHASIQKPTLTAAQFQERQNIRNAYLVATNEETAAGIKQFQAKQNWFAVACLLELAAE